jgi:hypothetical protein
MIEAPKLYATLKLKGQPVIALLRLVWLILGEVEANLAGRHKAQVTAIRVAVKDLGREIAAAKLAGPEAQASPVAFHGPCPIITILVMRRLPQWRSFRCLSGEVLDFFEIL